MWSEFSCSIIIVSEKVFLKNTGCLSFHRQDSSNYQRYIRKINAVNSDALLYIFVCIYVIHRVNKRERVTLYNALLRPTMQSFKTWFYVAFIIYCMILIICLNINHISHVIWKWNMAVYYAILFFIIFIALISLKRKIPEHSRNISTGALYPSFWHTSPSEICCNQLYVLDP